MRPFIYILILAVLAMFYKTFYWDYKKQEVPAEANQSVEAAVQVEAPPAAPQPTAVKAPESTTSANYDEANRTGWQSRKGMPIDRLGDSIAGSLKEKIK